MCYYITIFVFYKIRLPIIISLLVINFSIMCGNLAVCKILCSLNMCLFSQIEMKPSIFFNEIFARSNRNLVYELLPYNDHDDIPKIIGVSDFLFFLCKELHIRKFLFQLTLKLFL